MVDIVSGRRPQDFDPFAPSTIEDPYPFYRALREHAPVYRPPGADWYYVSRYADIKAVARDTTTYSSRLLDAATELELLNNPVYWTFGDFFVPFGVRWRFVPHELHVVLYEAQMGPVQSDGGPVPVEPQ